MSLLKSLKNWYKGRIYGNAKDPKWTQIIFIKRYIFQNPLRQNYKHIQYVKNINENKPQT